MDHADALQARYLSMVTRHAPSLYRMACRLGGDRAVAEDLVQETFEQAWRGFRRLRHDDRARAWLFRILRARFARHLRQQYRRPKVTWVSLEGRETSESIAAEEPPTTTLETRDLVQTALDRLDDKFKHVLLLVVMEGMSVDEASRVLRLRRGTVLSRVHRAKAKMRAILHSLGHGEVERGQREVSCPGDAPPGDLPTESIERRRSQPWPLSIGS